MGPQSTAAGAPPKIVKVDRPEDLPTCFAPYLASFPPGVDPLGYRRQEVAWRLRQMAILQHFSIPTPGRPNRVIVERDEAVGVHLAENLHRLQCRLPSVGGSGSLNDAASAAGEPCDDGLPQISYVSDRQIARVNVRFRPIAESYVASPHQPPPPLAFSHHGSARFELREGHFEYVGTGGTGFRGFGDGRIFPTVYGDQPQLRLGALVHVQQGLGQLAGIRGLLMLNGTVEPPEFMDLSITALVVDFEHRLGAAEQPLGLRPLPDPDPSSTFLLFRSTQHGKGVSLCSVGDQTLMTSVRADLRLAQADFAVRDHRLLYHLELGPRVGRVHTRMWVGPFRQGFVTPYQTSAGRLALHDRAGRRLGSLDANAMLGRAFLIDVPGAPIPAILTGGVGTVRRGSGLFEGANGMVTKLSLTSLFPRVASTFYAVRLDDPDGIYRSKLHEAWR